MGVLWRALVFFPQQQNGMGSLHNVDFGVFWVTWPGSGRNRVPGTGSGSSFRNRFWETVPGSEGCEPEVSKVSVFDGFQGVRFCSRGLDGPVLGTGFREPNVLRRFRVPEIAFPRFRELLCTSRKYIFVL